MNSGIINGTMITRATAHEIAGCLTTIAAHRAQKVASGSFGRGCIKAGRASRSTPRPRMASIAGKRVSDASTAVNTATAHAYPSEVTNGIWATARASRATMTVPPANTMAPPLVATASAIESLMAICCWRTCDRCFVTRNRA